MEKVTPKEINSIRFYLRHRGIETPALEEELLDHIVSATQEDMEEGMSFYDAFKSVIAKFGPFGLKKIQNKYYHTFENSVSKTFFIELKNLFITPYILVPIILFVFAFLFKGIIENQLTIIFASRALDIAISGFMISFWIYIYIIYPGGKLLKRTKRAIITWIILPLFLVFHFLKDNYLNEGYVPEVNSFIVSIILTYFVFAILAGLKTWNIFKNKRNKFLQYV